MVLDFLLFGLLFDDEAMASKRGCTSMTVTLRYFRRLLHQVYSVCFPAFRGERKHGGDLDLAPRTKGNLHVLCIRKWILATELSMLWRKLNICTVGCLTLRRLMSYIYIYIYIYIYGAPILDVSRSHTTTQHSR